jgi:ABC-type nitrate/sulfonate/bicarbonate transport system ATPase subunit
MFRWARMSTPRLSVERVSRTFPGMGGRARRRARRDATLAENDFIAILGPSGCSKSLLRIVAGLDEASSGRVLLDGAPVAGPGADRGMVFRSFLSFRGSRCLRTSHSVAGAWLAPAERTAIADAYIRRMGLAGSGTTIREPVRGMQRRTALARRSPAIPDPAAGKPFSALDHQTRSLMQELLPNVGAS